MRHLAVLLLILLVSCDDEDRSAMAANTTTKVYAIDPLDHIVCGDANAQGICVDLGYDDCVAYKCKNPDNTGVYIYEVTCEK